MNEMPSNLTAPDAATLQRLSDVTGVRYALTEPADMASYMVEWRDRYVGKAAMVLRPGTVEEISRILEIANETCTAIVPQGGNTGLVGAQIPFETGTEVVLSLGRLNKVRNVDPVDNTMTVDAGCILASVQAAADDADRLFPLSLGAEGSCQIGGNISSNAGGTAVLAYGNTRDLVLGLEVVLADGRVWNGLKRLRKDNTGYDLKNLFIGAEGTLGIVAGAVLKLFPKPSDRSTAMIGIAAPSAAVELLSLANDLSGLSVMGFEIIPRIGFEFLFKHGEGVRDPMAGHHPWYILMELSGGGERGRLDLVAENILAEGMERGLVADAVIAASEAQAQELWAMRTELSGIQKHEGGSIKFDVSVPVSAIPEFLERAAAAATAMIPNCRPVYFGHIGDGNIHCNISQPEGASREAFLARWSDMEAAVFNVVHAFNGSISAEHGIGRMKVGHMTSIKQPVELDLMRRLKRVFDPKGILNPGKLLPPEI